MTANPRTQHGHETANDDVLDVARDRRRVGRVGDRQQHGADEQTDARRRTTDQQQQPEHRRQGDVGERIDQHGQLGQQRELGRVADAGADDQSPMR